MPYSDISQKIVGVRDRVGVIARAMTVCLFAGLWVFEMLNELGVLHFNVEYTWIGRVISTTVVAGVLLLLNKVSKKYIGQPLHGYVFFAAMSLILIDFFGDVFGLYGYWEPYDRVAHFLSGFFLVGSFFILYQQLSEAFDWRHPRAFTYLLAFQTSLAFAGLYEMEEYVEDLFFGSHRSGGGVDTADDITMNVIGSALTVLVILSYRAWKTHRAKQALSLSGGSRTV